MPSKKKGKAKAGAAEAAASGAGGPAAGTPPALLSDVDAVTAAAAAAPSTSLSAACAGLLTKPASELLPQKVTSPGGASSSSAKAWTKLEDPLPQDGAQSSQVFVPPEPEAEEFHDALEELVQSGEVTPDEEDQDPLAALVAKDSTLKGPTPDRDWAAEMERLELLLQDAAVSDAERAKTLHDALAQRAQDLQAWDEHATAVSRTAENLAKERDRAKKDMATSLAVKAKLEESCRELQQMKISIAAESKKLVEEEKERQTELNDKFKLAMEDVEEKMKAEADIREHFIKENEELRTKLNTFTSTYDEQERKLSEQHTQRQKEMEAARARLKEYETKGAESGRNAIELEKKNKVLKKTTETLKTDLQSILSKFDEFRESVNGSNLKHDECKADIDSLSSKLKELDDENAELKKNERINEVTKEKESSKKQVDALERLCGNLEREIATIRERIRTSGKKGGC